MGHVLAEVGMGGSVVVEGQARRPGGGLSLGVVGVGEFSLCAGLGGQA